MKESYVNLIQPRTNIKPERRPWIQVTLRPANMEQDRSLMSCRTTHPENKKQLSFEFFMVVYRLFSPSFSNICECLKYFGLKRHVCFQSHVLFLGKSEKSPKICHWKSNQQTWKWSAFQDVQHIHGSYILCIYPLDPKTMKHEGFKPPKIWVITPKNEGFGGHG